MARFYYFNQPEVIIFGLSPPLSEVNPHIFPQQGPVSPHLFFWKLSWKWTEKGARARNQKKYTLLQVFQQGRVGNTAGDTCFHGPGGPIMNTKFDILFTFKFVYYFWKNIYIAPLMLVLLLATLIIFKTDIWPEAGCHL